MQKKGGRMPVQTKLSPLAPIAISSYDELPKGKYQTMAVTADEFQILRRAVPKEAPPEFFLIDWKAIGEINYNPEVTR
jgi:hypothetical protein